MIDEKMKEFEKCFESTRDHPGYELLKEDYLKFLEKNPDFQELSDLPFFRFFSGINWGNWEEIKILLKVVLDEKQKLIKDFQAVMKNEKAQFIFGLIHDLASYKATATFLQLKLTQVTTSPPGPDDTIH
jgi:hypothetical protein